MSEDDDIPRIDDDVVTTTSVKVPPSPRKQRGSQSKGGSTFLSGSSLVPDLDQHAAMSLVSYWYWVGVIPECPKESIDLAGISFPKINAEFVRGIGSTKDRVPVIGALVQLTQRKILLIKDRLPRTVVRFLEDPGQIEEPGTGKNMGDPYQRPRKGHLITIPTKEEIAQAIRMGRPTREYIARAFDQPAARYMFAVLCEDQDRPTRGTAYPDVLEKTGLVWPEKI